MNIAHQICIAPMFAAMSLVQQLDFVADHGFQFYLTANSDIIFAGSYFG